MLVFHDHLEKAVKMGAIINHVTVSRHSKMSKDKH
jgi:hypothetical protein